jgi:Zn-dependent M28 family amino/carboxypeptidase
VVGVLKSKPNEYVVFSGHYDHPVWVHLQKSKHDATDSIYNGANDDAAGTTAVILLADYFKKMNNNERSIFHCFVAEELGGYGSKYFRNRPAQVMAMFNLEMIGTESKWGGIGLHY